MHGLRLHTARVDRSPHPGFEDGRALHDVVPSPFVYVLGDQCPRQLDHERDGRGGDGTGERVGV
jgi:hypothetical protein